METKIFGLGCKSIKLPTSNIYHIVCKYEHTCPLCVKLEQPCRSFCGRISMQNCVYAIRPRDTLCKACLHHFHTGYDVHERGWASWIDLEYKYDIK